MEGRIAFERLFSRFPRLSLAGATPTRSDRLVLRGYHHLPVLHDG
jgi:cytochrome P450